MSSIVRNKIALFLLCAVCCLLFAAVLAAQETGQLSYDARKFRAKIELDGRPLYLQSFSEPSYDSKRKCNVFRTISYKGKDPLSGFVVYEVGIDEKDGTILFMNELKLPHDPVEAFKEARIAAIEAIKSYHPKYKPSFYSWDYVKDAYRLVVFYRPEAMTVDSWYCQVDVNSKDGTLVVRGQGLRK